VTGRALSLLLVAVLVTACVPLFLPPVPRDGLTPEAAWRVHGDAGLEVLVGAGGAARGLRLTFTLVEVPEAAWLALQWFGPTGGERASDARWVSPEDVGRPLVWEAPAGLELVAGRWRAVLSVGDRLLRQFDVEVPTGAP
jgi:hypothetical protein